jgi:hypothetical protein
VAESRIRRARGRVGEESDMCFRRCEGRECRVDRREVEDVGFTM